MLDAPDVVPVFDQLPPDVQDHFLDLVALVLLDQALAELDYSDPVVVVTDDRKAG